jgi:hypothetical protein
MSLILAAALLAPLQEEEGLGTPADWARALDGLDLSLSVGDLSVELAGELSAELLVFDQESPGLSLEDAPLRSDHYKRTRQEDRSEVVARAKLFLEIAYADWLSASVEARADRGAPAIEGEAWGARLEQYWVRLEVPGVAWAPRFTLGKFAAPVGNFLPRHQPSKNPLPAFPILYDHVTTFASVGDVPAQLLARRDRPTVKDWRAPVWREVYGTGAMLSGDRGTFTYAVAVMNSAPGTWGFDWSLHQGDFRDPNLYLRAAWAVHPSTTLGASWSRGPYERQDADGLPRGRDAGDFPQTFAGADVAWAWGDLDVFAEVCWTRFDAPATGGVDLLAWYTEAKVTLLPGLFAAARLGQVRFGEVRDAAGESHRWDRDTTRVEFGGGYFFTKNLFLKSAVMLNYAHGGREPHDTLWMTQWVLSF